MIAVLATFLVNAGLNFVLGLVIARFLGPDEFGRFAIAQTIALFLNTAFFDWVRLSTARHYSEQVRAEAPDIRATLDGLEVAVTASVAIMLAVVVLLGLDFRLSLPLVASSFLAAVANGLFDYHATLARARFLDRVYALLVALKNVGAFGLAVAGAFYWGSATIALLGIGLGTLFSLAIFRRRLDDPGVSLAAASPARAFAFMRYGLPLVAANAIYTAMMLMNRSFIAAEFGYAESGYFSLAYDVGVRVLAVVGSGLDLLLFPLAMRAEAAGGPRAGEARIARNIVIVLALIAPTAAGYWLVLPGFQALVVPGAFRAGFEAYSTVLIPLILCFGVINYVLNPIFQMARATAPVVVAAVAGLIANLIAARVLPGQFGAIGYAHAALVGYGVATGIALVMAAVAIRAAPRGRDILGVLVATGVMLAALAPIRALEPPLAAMAIIVVAGLALYGAIAWAFDIADIRAWLGRRRGRSADAPRSGEF